MSNAYENEAREDLINQVVELREKNALLTREITQLGLRVHRAIDVLAAVQGSTIPGNHVDAYLLGVLQGTLRSLRGEL